MDKETHRQLDNIENLVFKIAIKMGVLKLSEKEEEDEQEDEQEDEEEDEEQQTKTTQTKKKEVYTQNEFE